jgi:hypothetical protein
LQHWSDSDELLLRLKKRQRELILTKRSLPDWCRLCGFEPAEHHELLLRILTGLVRGSLTKRKVMVFMPPGSAKSTYGSILFPPWAMAQNDNISILACSHSEDLAERFSFRVKSLIDLHYRALGISLDPNQRATSRWKLAGGVFKGEYLAAGSGSAIAGFRGDIGLIDDPVRGKESVQSETARQKLWEWYLFDFRPRLKPNAKQIIIMTRWHEDDLAARILESEGDEWLVIKLPMVAEDIDDPLGREIGERLWADWFTEEQVREAQKDPSLWLSLYQQRPTAETGTYWQRAWLHPVPASRIPQKHHLKLYGGSDYAVTKGGGDWTVHAVIGLDESDRPWLLDLWRARTASDVWVEAWCTLVKWWKPMQWGEERGQIISGVGPWLEREANKHRAFTERIQFVSRLDKGVRAQAIRGYIANRGLWYDENLPERPALEAELLSFPAGKNDDIHDALGLCGQLLDMAITGKVPKKKKPEVDSGYRRTGTQREGPSIKTL